MHVTVSVHYINYNRHMRLHDTFLPYCYQHEAVGPLKLASLK